MLATLEGLFHDLDAERTGCPRPSVLPPAMRHQGFIILEKRDGNIHAHILVSCRDLQHQFFTSMSLFKLLDNVPEREDPRDDAWQRDMWKLLCDRREMKDLSRTRSYAPLLAKWTPGATAMVQVVRTDHDLQQVARYITKEAPRGHNARPSAGGADQDFMFHELRDFHPSDLKNPASCIRIDPRTGTQTLNLDDPRPWKRIGKRL